MMCPWKPLLLMKDYKSILQSDMWFCGQTPLAHWLICGLSTALVSGGGVDVEPWSLALAYCWTLCCSAPITLFLSAVLSYQPPACY